MGMHCADEADADDPDAEPVGHIFLPPGGPDATLAYKCSSAPRAPSNAQRSPCDAPAASTGAVASMGADQPIDSVSVRVVPGPGRDLHLRSACCQGRAHELLDEAGDRVGAPDYGQIEPGGRQGDWA